MEIKAQEGSLSQERSPRWSLLRLSPQSQCRYIRLVEEYLPQVEYYYPVYQCYVRPHGKRPVKVTRPVYPGYVFVRVDPGGVEGLTGLPVRAYWVKFDGIVETVPDKVIQRIKEFEGRNELVQEVIYVNPYRAGTRVYVHLPMADLLTVIIKVVGPRAVVDLPMARCTVPLHLLEVA